MTLCIAAIAKDEDNRFTLACCVDKRVETESSGSETGFKLRYISGFAGVMLSGSVSRAEEFIRMLRARAAELGKPNIASTVFQDELRKTVQEFRSKLVNEYVQSVLSMSYAELLSTGSESIPDALRQAVFDEVTRIDIGSEFIVFGLPSAELYTVHKNGSIMEHGNFCAVGSGSPNAEAWLHFREQHQMLSLEKTLIHIYEAKRFSENAPGVGKKTRLVAITRDEEENAIIMDDDALGSFSRLWNKYGPRSLETKEIDLFVIPEGNRFTWNSRGFKREKAAG